MLELRETRHLRQITLINQACFNQSYSHHHPSGTVQKYPLNLLLSLIPSYLQSFVSSHFIIHLQEKHALNTSHSHNYCSLLCHLLHLVATMFSAHIICTPTSYTRNFRFSVYIISSLLALPTHIFIFIFLKQATSTPSICNCLRSSSYAIHFIHLLSKPIVWFRNPRSNRTVFLFSTIVALTDLLLRHSQHFYLTTRSSDACNAPRSYIRTLCLLFYISTTLPSHCLKISFKLSSLTYFIKLTGLYCLRDIALFPIHLAQLSLFTPPYKGPIYKYFFLSLLKHGHLSLFLPQYP